MKNFLTLKNLSVLSKNDFCIIGKITDCILDLSLKKIAYFLCIKDESVLLLSPSAISSVDDAVVVDNLTDIRKVEDVDFTAFKTVVGKTVYTNSGVKKGVVLDVVCSGENVVEFVLEDGTVKPNEVQGVGEIVLMKAPAKRKRKKKTDLFACLDEHLVRILCGNLSGVVLRVSVNNNYFVLVAGKRLVADTFQTGFNSFSFVKGRDNNRNHELFSTKFRTLLIQPSIFRYSNCENRPTRSSPNPSRYSRATLMFSR